MDDSQMIEFIDTQPQDFDPSFPIPIPEEPPESAQPPVTDKKSSLLDQPERFDEDAINAEFQEEYQRLERVTRELDVEFQNLVKELRLWICASIEPLTEEWKAKFAQDIEDIKTMEEKQEDLRVRIVDCMKAVETALSLLNQAAFEQ